MPRMGRIVLPNYRIMWCSLMDKRLPQEKVIELSERFISNSTAMPDWVKSQH